MKAALRAALTFALTLFAAAAASLATATAGNLVSDKEWSAYKARFIAPEGRLFDVTAGGVSHTEGQGYAMLLAAFADDSETFAKLWDWTHGNLYIRGDDLGAWRWRPQDEPHVKDRNNASDGDLLIAWALAEGGARWRKPEYVAQSHKIGVAVGRKAVSDGIFGKSLSPGVQGFGADDVEDGPIVNPSYWVFPAFDALAATAPEIDWASLRDSGLALLDGAKFGPKRLPSDWVSTKFGLRPAAGFPKRFGWDAIRVPLYLAWGAPDDKARLAPFADDWAAAPAVLDAETGSVLESLTEPGYRAIGALARCAVHGTAFPKDLRTVPMGRYYSSTLHMLSLAAARQRFPQCL